MLPVVEMPEMGRPAAPCFAAVCSPEAFQPFQRDLRGWMLSAHNTVAGLTRICVLEVRHQRRRHRVCTERPWSVDAFKQARFEGLERRPGTQMNASGVVSLEATLCTHAGTSVANIASVDDAAQTCDVRAHTVVKLPESDEQPEAPASFT